MSCKTHYETHCQVLRIDDCKYFFRTVKNEKNKAFSDRLEPFIKNIALNINEVGGNKLTTWDYWYNMDCDFSDWCSNRRYEAFKEWLFSWFFSHGFESKTEDLKEDFGKYLKRLLKSTNVDGAWKSYHDKSKYLNNRGSET